MKHPRQARLGRLAAAVGPLLLAAPLLAGTASPSSGPMPGTRPPGGPSSADDDIDFEALGQAFREAHCPEGNAECDLEEALAASFAHMVVGTFEVHFPIERLSDKGKAKDFSAAVLALLDLQEKWIEWLAGDTDGAAAAKVDIATVREWVSDWKASQLGQLTADNADIYDFLEAPQDVRDAAERLNVYLHDEEELGLVIPDEDLNAQVMLCPDRLSFMQAVGFAGLTSDTERDQYWHGGVHEWTQIWTGWTFTLALEYAPWGGIDKSFKQGLDMNKFEKTGLEEHVIQRCTMALFRYCRPGYDPGHLGTATALAMAIEICGQVKTIDGVGARGTSGATTQAYERFVPGGNPQGGVLPAIPAAPFNVMTENHWRRGGGKDYFSAPLKKGQKEGAKKIKKYDKDSPLVGDKSAHFLLEGYEKGGKWGRQRTLLRGARQREVVPRQRLHDRLPGVLPLLTRRASSTGSGITAWPTTRSSRSRSSASSCGAMGEVDEDVGLHELIEEIYGTPLSGTDGLSDNLEWAVPGLAAQGQVESDPTVLAAEAGPSAAQEGEPFLAGQRAHELSRQEAVEVVLPHLHLWRVPATVVPARGQSDLDRLADGDVLALRHAGLLDALGDEALGLGALGLEEEELVVHLTTVRAQREHVVGVEARGRSGFNMKFGVHPHVQGRVADALRRVVGQARVPVRRRGMRTGSTRSRRPRSRRSAYRAARRGWGACAGCGSRRRGSCRRTPSSCTRCPTPAGPRTAAGPSPSPRGARRARRRPRATTWRARRG